MADSTPLFSPAERLSVRTDLMSRDRVIVILRHPVDTPHGMRLEQFGDPILVVCGCDGRQNQAGMFANSGNEDVQQTQGGLTEITPLEIIAREWPGDIWSTVWYDGDAYDTIGQPVERRHGTEKSRHWEVRAERKRRGVPKPVVPEEARVWGT
ncbi:MAG: hypothetical protein SOI13_01615 [Bifidobacterium mongoliense]|jgi:hypothetical protein|uniref:hypothetical protein n=1 Tax=Bifidobacterium mongoliense TaxID=518643 RepID=UPI002F35EE36